jgi:hypothetical protein
MLNVSSCYVGDSTPAVAFTTLFPVQSVKIGVEKKNTKIKYKIKNEKLENYTDPQIICYLPRRDLNLMH